MNSTNQGDIENSAPELATNHHWEYFLVACLVVSTVLAYIPAINGNFAWDDDMHLTNNIVLQKNGLYRCWFTTQPPIYWPVTWTSYWLEYQFWGLNPYGYHVVNILLHAICALLVWRLLIQLKIPGAWLAALIFALHPVNVESVAWITQRKNLLSMLFFLISLFLYVRFDKNGRRSLYWLSVASFLLGMLSKGAIVTLPVVLLILAWWLHATISRRDVLRSLPFFVVSAIMSVVEVWFQYVKIIGSDIVRQDTFLARIAGAGWVVWFYLYKLLVPINLCSFYPRWEINTANWLSYMPAVVLLALMSLFWWYRRSWGRPLFFALGYFVVMIAPAMGFVHFYFLRYSYVADHYQYMATIGPIALITAAGYFIADKLGRWAKIIATLTAISILAIFAVLTWQRCYIYDKAELLWRDTLRKNPNAWMAHSNLGLEMLKQRKFDEAITCFRQALKNNPDFAEAHSNFAGVLLIQGRSNEAMNHFLQSVQLKPDDPRINFNCGLAMSQMGKYDDALKYLNKALRANPNWPETYYNLGQVYAKQGKHDLAIKNYNEALRIRPNYLDATKKLAISFKEQGNIEQAIKQWEKVLKIEPHDPGTYFNLGLTMAQYGKYDDAVKYFTEALRLKPDWPQAYYCLGLAYDRQGNYQLAVKNYKQALRIKPDFAEARENLDIALSKQGRTNEPIK